MAKDITDQLRRDVDSLRRQVAHIPARIAEVVNDDVPFQLAVLVELFNIGVSPHYTAAADLSTGVEPDPDTFKLADTYAEVVYVYVVLLDTFSGGDPGGTYLEGFPVPILNPSGLTIELLRVGAQDLRKEGNPRALEVVRVWRGDGAAVQPGLNSNDGVPVYCEPYNVGDYLRGLSTFVHGTPRIISYDAVTDELVWVDFGDAGSVPDWVFDYPTDPITGGGGDSVGEGYCITIVTTFDLKTIHFDAITNDAGIVATDRDLDEFQFFAHGPGATAREHAKWITAHGYDATKNQSFRHEDGTWFADTDPLTGTVGVAIEKATASNLESGTGIVYEADTTGAIHEVGSRTLWNPFRFTVRRDCTLAHIAGEEYLIISAPGYRAIRGQCTANVAASAVTFTIDHIVPLQSGADPRDDRTNAFEAIMIKNVPAEPHANDDWIIADYNAESDAWEARRIGMTRTGRVTTAISAPAGGTLGSGEVKLQDPFTLALELTATAVKNDKIGETWDLDCQVVLDMNYTPPRVLGGGCDPVEWS